MMYARGKLIWLSLLAAVIMVAVTCMPSPTHAAPPTGKVRLSHNNDAYYAELTSTTDWSNVGNYGYHATQGGSVWTITSLGNGKYKLESAGKALTMNSSTDYAPVKSAAYSGWTSQQWTITDLGNGYYKLECNGKALTGDTAGNGVTVKSAAYNGYSTQKWKLTAVDTTGWPAGTWDWVYQNVDRTTRLAVENRQNVLIIGSHIHDVADDLGILISNSNQVHIKNTTVQNLDDNSDQYGKAIYLYRSDNIVVDNATIKELAWSGTSFHSHAMHIYAGENITVQNSKIFDVDGNGITIEADNTNILIDHNEIYNTGRNVYSATAPYHGIYSKAPDVTIQNNTIYNSLDGSAITMRSTGVVQGNTLYNNKHSAVAYWPDYPKGASDKLEIKNNTIWHDNYTTSNSKAVGIGINYTTGKPAENYFNNFYIDNNTITVAAGNSNGAITCHQATGTWSIGNVRVTNNSINDDRATPNYLDGEQYMSFVDGNIFN